MPALVLHFYSRDTVCCLARVSRMFTFLLLSVERGGQASQTPTSQGFLGDFDGACDMFQGNLSK